MIRLGTIVALAEDPDRAAGQSTEAAGLVGLGATRLAWEDPADPGFVVVADTDGDRFRVVDASQG